MMLPARDAASTLEAAARSPPPPVPSRRPDLTRLNLPRRSRGRGQRQAPPPAERDGGAAGSAERVAALFDLAREGSVARLVSWGQTRHAPEVKPAAGRTISQCGLE